MSIPRKHWILIILISVSVAIVLMAASLSSLELRPYRARTFNMEMEESKSPDKDSLGPVFYIFIRLVLFLVGILLPLSLFLNLLTPKGRKRIFALFILFLAFLLIGSHVRRSTFQFQLPNLKIQGLRSKLENPISQVEKIPPTPPWWLVFGASLGLSVLILAALFFLWRRLRRRTDPLELVAREAQKTLDELSTGIDVEEGVIRCYYEMSHVLSNQRGLKRQQSMTTREFENYLEAAGLPSVHIKRLTRLFEKVRYGAKNLGKLEDREAIDCLSAIVQACEGSQ